MGQDHSQSKEAQDSLQRQHTELKAVEGFQVVRLLPHSPAHQAGLLPYFDIITALDHHVIAAQEGVHFSFFKRYLSEHRNQQVCFTVYNLKLRSHREVFVVPSDKWGGGGLLGCSVEWARADECVQRCWHIVGILEGSPASFCPDLHEERDYIIGMQQPEEQLVAMLKGDDDFYGRLSMWQELQRTAAERKARFPGEPIDIPHSLLLLLYDLQENCVKEVLVDMGTRPGTPLGISVATGLLHIIPTAAPGANINNASGADGGDVPDLANLPYMNRFYVPRDLSFETDYPGGPSQPMQPPPPEEPAKEVAAGEAPPPAPPTPPQAAPPSPQHASEHHQPQPPRPPALQNPFAGGTAAHNPFAAGLVHDTHPSQQQQHPHGPHSSHDGTAPRNEPEEEDYFNHPHPQQTPSPPSPPTAHSMPQPSPAQPPPQQPPASPSRPQTHPQQMQQLNHHEQQPQPQPQPVRFDFPAVPPPLDFPSFPRPQRA